MRKRERRVYHIRFLRRFQYRTTGYRWSLDIEREETGRCNQRRQQDGTTGNVAQIMAGGAYNILRSWSAGGDYVLEGWDEQDYQQVCGIWHQDD